MIAWREDEVGTDHVTGLDVLDDLTADFVSVKLELGELAGQIRLL